MPKRSSISKAWSLSFSVVSSSSLFEVETSAVASRITLILCNEDEDSSEDDHPYWGIEKLPTLITRYLELVWFYDELMLSCVLCIGSWLVKLWLWIFYISTIFYVLCIYLYKSIGLLFRRIFYPCYNYKVTIFRPLHLVLHKISKVDNIDLNHVWLGTT